MSASIIEPGLGNEWDLGQILTERVQPTDSVEVYLSEAASYAKDKLTKQLATVTEDVIVKQIEESLTEAEASLAATKYTFHLTGVPSRMRDDIYSKAMVEVPVKPTNLLGGDDAENAKKRTRVANVLTWLAQIVAIENPLGEKNYEFSREVMESVYDGLPHAARESVNRAIAELTKASERFTVGSQNQDF